MTGSLLWYYGKLKVNEWDAGLSGLSMGIWVRELEVRGSGFSFSARASLCFMVQFSFCDLG